MKLDNYFITHTKINSKWIKDLNLRSETIELLEKNLSGKLLGTGLSNYFFDFTPKAKAMKVKINKRTTSNQKASV